MSDLICLTTYLLIKNDINHLIKNIYKKIDLLWIIVRNKRRKARFNFIWIDRVFDF